MGDTVAAVVDLLLSLPLPVWGLMCVACLCVSACNFACASNTASIEAEKEQFDKNFRLAQHEARAAALKEILSSKSIGCSHSGSGKCPHPRNGNWTCVIYFHHHVE